MLDMRTDLEGNHQVQRSEVSYNHPQFVGPVLAPGARLGPAWARNSVGTRDSLQSFDAPRHRSQTQGEEHMTRKIWFTTDDYGNLCRVVSGTGFVFWQDAPSKKRHELYMSWGDVDDWGEPLDWASYPTKKNKHMSAWITTRCPTIAGWQADMIAEHTLPERRWHGLTEDEFKKIVLDTYNIDLNKPDRSPGAHPLWQIVSAKINDLYDEKGLKYREDWFHYNSHRIRKAKLKEKNHDID